VGEILCGIMRAILREIQREIPRVIPRESPREILSYSGLVIKWLLSGYGVAVRVVVLPGMP